MRHENIAHGSTIYQTICMFLHGTNQSPHMSQAPLKVGGHFLTSPISVLEQKSGPQFIFGLDNMRRHACIIDLVRGVRVPYILFSQTYCGPLLLFIRSPWHAASCVLLVFHPVCCFDACVMVVNTGVGVHPVVYVGFSLITAKDVHSPYHGQRDVHAFCFFACMQKLKFGSIDKEVEFIPESQVSSCKSKFEFLKGRNSNFEGRGLRAGPALTLLPALQGCVCGSVYAVQCLLPFLPLPLSFHLLGLAYCIWREIADQQLCTPSFCTGPLPHSLPRVQCCQQCEVGTYSQIDSCICRQAGVYASALTVMGCALNHSSPSIIPLCRSIIPFPGEGQVCDGGE